MLDVIITLLPAAAFAVYAFGLNALLVLVISTLSAILFEYGWQHITKQTIRIYDLSAVVTGLLVGLNLPANAPWWMPIIGSGLAIIIVKQLFGGIGDNFVNPALAARAMLLSSWPARMASFTSPTFFSGADAVTTATPLSGAEYSLSDLFFGNVPGTMGEVCKLAILIGFAYLLIRKVISWRIPVTLLAVFALFSWLFGEDPLVAVLSGGVLFGAVFMATDYTTSPMSEKGQFIYAALAGVIIAVIRSFGRYPEGVTYGILVMNVATPLIDKYIKPRLYGRLKEEKANG